MGLEKSVGRDAENRSVDTRVVQAALNLVKHPDFHLDQKLLIDGQMGKSTIAAIEHFQTQVVKTITADGRVNPAGQTVVQLKAHLQKGLSFDALMAIMALAPPSCLAKFEPLFPAAFADYQISSALRQSHFLAQIGHESSSLRYTEELGSGEEYEGREDLGNTQAGDGKRFKGRGLIQLIGRENYQEYGEHIERDLLQEGNEVLVSNDPRFALDVSLWFWQTRNLNHYADLNDIKAITHRIKGGTHDLDDREKYLARALFFLV